MTIQPYLIVPKLIPQPTWGGQYIAQMKGLTDPKLAKQNIGQSYELSSETMLTTQTQSDQVPIEIGDPKDGHTLETIGDLSKVFSLQKLIAENPTAVLGSRAIEVHGEKMNVLIKFTQAKGNSFQVHVRPGMEVEHRAQPDSKQANDVRRAQLGVEQAELAHWKPKPESWYFLEQGKASLGLANPTPERLGRYMQACEAIDEFAQKIEARIKKQEMEVSTARKDLNELIAQLNPFQYVNVTDVAKDTVIDLSAGGIHHSWEEDKSLPNGNIIYEVQVNVMDNECTLRSFDKGKIADDGSVRPVHVKEYFTALDTDPARNEVSSLIQTPQQTKTGTMLFATPYYTSELVEFQHEYRVSRSTQESFTHIFIQEGEVTLTTDATQLVAKRGSSIFVPASTRDYVLRTEGKSVVIMTRV